MSVVLVGTAQFTAFAQDEKEPAAAALPPVQVAILVDESGSLTPEDVEREKEAARTIALGVLAEGSTVSVTGFGSSNAAGQSPVDTGLPTDCDRLVPGARPVGDLYRPAP